MNGGRDFTNDDVPLSVFSAVEIEAVWPALGSERGGAIVEVRGRNFRDSGSSLLCRFGASLSPNVTFVSPHLLLCESPPAPATSEGPDEEEPLQIETPFVGSASPLFGVGRSVAVQVSLNGLDFSGSSDHLFFYYREPEVSLVSPSVVDVKGGGFVTLFGTGFFDRFSLYIPPSVEQGTPLSREQEAPVTCSFSGAPSMSARVLNSTAVECQAPSLEAVRQATGAGQEDLKDGVSSPPPLTIATIAVRWNDQQATVATATVAFVRGPTVNETLPSSGPDEGGTIVRVYGTDFRNTSQLSCR